MAIARVAFRCSEAEIDEGTFLVCSKKSDQSAECNSGEDAKSIRIRREDVFAMRCFELQVDHEERHRVARQKHQGGPVSGIPLPIHQSDDLQLEASHGEHVFASYPYGLR